MKLQVLNVHFFPKKGEILINRGVYSTWMGVTTEGGLVVKLKGFDRYYFDPHSGEVYARTGVKTYRPLKRWDNNGKPYYFLYWHGQKTKVFFSKILLENMKGIEIFFSEENRDGRKIKHELEIV